MTREEAIKELRGFVGQLTEGCQDVIKVLIPELVESEDERIREWLIDTIKAVPNDSIEWDVIDKSHVLAWLEKQKEPIEGIKGNSEEIPSNVDLEKELQAFLCNYDYEYDDDAPAYDIARHFYELGLNVRKEE